MLASSLQVDPATKPRASRPRLPCLPRWTIRAATSDDLDDLLRIENAAFASDRIKRSSFRRLIASPTASILVCEHDGECAGYALVLTRAKCRDGRLYSLAV